MRSRDMISDILKVCIVPIMLVQFVVLVVVYTQCIIVGNNCKNNTVLLNQEVTKVRVENISPDGTLLENGKTIPKNSSMVYARTTVGSGVYYLPKDSILCVEYTQQDAIDIGLVYLSATLLFFMTSSLAFKNSRSGYSAFGVYFLQLVVVIVEMVVSVYYRGMFSAETEYFALIVLLLGFVSYILCMLIELLVLRKGRDSF